ncbi:MAG: MBL fold metallo-hydrolase [Fuerstiella sp.]|jgi:metallo-beta-lactamase family protein|nr:MBL fold metallo-hydrolase [Fuerstiella sp.]
MRITFLGAAGEVTGSQHLIETDSRRILLDCGLFQGADEETRPKNGKFHCVPRKIDAVILSHAHIDHSGNLPGLVKAGFDKPIFCTRATADIAAMMLRDSARIQREDAKYLRKKARPEDAPVEPLYSEDNAREVAQLFEYVPFGQWETLGDDVRLRFHHAGHILGSAICELELMDQGEWKRLVFTGDLGRRGKPLLHDPATVERCDVVITESTYGNRVHPNAGDVKAALQRIICQASRSGGKVIIPAFSLGRTQLLVYLLNELRNENAMCRVPVYIDSPLATRLTDIYRDHQEGLDADVQETLRFDDDIFNFDGLYYVRSRDESIALNRQKGSLVVISASGMCENGRVVHHLKHAVSGPENTVMIIGYQAKGTLGRQLIQRNEYVYIRGRRYRLEANVETVNGLSAHADAEDFRWWFDTLQRNGGCGRAFIVHGETAAAQALAVLIDDTCDTPPVIPRYGESFEV